MSITSRPSSYRGGGFILLVILCFILHSQCPAEALLVLPPTSLALSLSGSGSAFINRRPLQNLDHIGFRRGQSIIHTPSTSYSSLALFPDYYDSTSLLLSSLESGTETTALQTLAEGLGYLLGAASILLYTPIAVRILRTKSADGLTVSTWWLKLTSYTCTDVYNIKNGFPFAAFSETLVITFEAVIILGLVTYFQKRLDTTTLFLTCAYLIITIWALFTPYVPDNWISAAQVLATVLNTSALLPQLKQNLDRKSSGDYSPVTASLASAGCAIRIFTTMQLANGDPLILLNYGVALVLNMSVLLQILYFGTQTEGKSLVTLFLADVKSSEEEMTDEGAEKLLLVDETLINAVKMTKEEEMERMTTLSRR